MKPSISIAIIGAGICGLATAFHCLDRGIGKIAIFDGHSPGENPRSILAGLLHPLPGMRARAIPQFSLLRQKAMRLFQIAQTHVDKPLFSKCGLFRVATTARQTSDFQRAAQIDCHGLFPADLSNFISHSGNGPKTGLWIDDAVAVHIPRYQVGLWRHLKSRGVLFEKKTVSNPLHLLKNWQIVIIAAGFGSAELSRGSRSINPLRGQWFVFQTPSDRDELKIGLNEGVYAFPIPGEKGAIFGGATFEHTSELLTKPDLKGEQLLTDCRQLIGIAGITVENYSSSLRSFTVDHTPVVSWLSDRVGVITAMGSKGLVRHANCADRLIASHPILGNSFSSSDQTSIV